MVRRLVKRTNTTVTECAPFQLTVDSMAVAFTICGSGDYFRLASVTTASNRGSPWSDVRSVSFLIQFALSYPWATL